MSETIRRGSAMNGVPVTLPPPRRVEAVPAS